MLAGQAIESLQCSGANIGIGERSQLLRPCDGGEEGCIGKEGVQLGQDVFRPSVSGQPVGDKSEVHKNVSEDTLYSLPMLRTPRPLPQRFNRPVTLQTRRLVERRTRRARDGRTKRVQRVWQRWQRRANVVRRALMRMLLLAVPTAIVFGVGFLLFSSALHIRAVRIPLTDPRIDVEQVQQGLASLFGRHLFFLHTHDVHKAAHNVVPDLATVSVAKAYPATLEVRLTLRPLVARLSIDDPNVTQNARDVRAGATSEDTGSGAGARADTRGDFLTEDGLYVAYAQTQVQSGAALPQLHIVDWGVRPMPGTLLLEPDMLVAMREAEHMLEEQFRQTVRLRIVYLRAREFQLETSVHALWFDLRTPVADQLARYRTFLQTVGEEAARQYVDLRLVDKIIYQ